MACELKVYRIKYENDSRYYVVVAEDTTKAIAAGREVGESEESGIGDDVGDVLTLETICTYVDVVVPEAANERRAAG